MEIRRVNPSQHKPALSRLMAGGGDLSEDQFHRLDAYVRQLGVDYRHLWAGYDQHDQPDQAALIVPRPGRTAMLFVSCPRKRAQIELLTQVIEAAVVEITPDVAVLIQAMVDPGEAMETAALEGAGFKYLATLSYMQRSVPPSAEAPVWPNGARLVQYGEADRPLFAEALAASYEQTADCPDLCGLRAIDDVIAGHMSAGRFDAKLWTLLMLDEKPAGVVLLNRIPEQHCIELVYLGLSAWARGRGLGSLLMQHSLVQCAADGQPTMTLAVDQDNKPATKLYRRFGFYRVARKVAMMRRLQDQP